MKERILRITRYLKNEHGAFSLVEVVDQEEVTKIDINGKEFQGVNEERLLKLHGFERGALTEACVRPIDDSITQVLNGFSIANCRRYEGADHDPLAVETALALNPTKLFVADIRE